MSKKGKKQNVFVSFFKKIYEIIDKIIITPLSRLIYNILKFTKSGNSQIEKIINKPNLLIYVSLGFAIVLFLLVDSKVITLVEKDAEIVTNIPIQVKYNEESYVIEGLPDTADVIFTGRKSDIYLAKQLGDYEVYLDLSDYDSSDTPYKVHLSMNTSIDSIDYKIDPSYVSVTIKNKISVIKTLSYDLMNQDKLDQKLSVKNIELDKSEIVVKGSQEQVDQVASVKALIDLSNKEFKDAVTYTVEDVPLVAYDKKGKVLNNVEIVPNKISAKVTLDSYSTRVPISVTTTGELTSGKAISKVTIQDYDNNNIDNIEIYGDKETIDSITSVPVSIDVTNQGLTASKSYDVTITKPAGVRYLSKNKAKITVEFGTEVQKTIANVPISSIKNLGDGLNAMAKTTEDASVTVQVKGTEEVINSITADNIVAYIDLANLTAGEYQVEVKIDTNDPRVTYLATSKVNIVIDNK
ncbi:MAG: hypothetical protein IJ574_00700 [Bacilli bacterium]|nr:hypothetical protein [Bacilli bacterium]